MKREEYSKNLEGLPEEKREALLKIFDEQSQSFQEQAGELKQLADIKNQMIQERDQSRKRLKVVLDKLGTEYEIDADGNPQIDDNKVKLGEAELKIEQLKKQIDELLPFKDKHNEIKAKYDKVESDRRAEIIEQIPEKETEIIDIAKKISSLEDLKSYVKIAVEKLGKKTVDSGRGGNGVLNVEGKTWDDFSIAERQQLYIQNKPAYDKLKEKKYGNK